jgi:2,4-dienoyl-CoA reductase-like NADH-dependent reductase (Old Yellow Enzyme family)
VGHASVGALFRPYSIGGLNLPNRIVMSPMTRSFSPGGVPGLDVATYYRRRTEGGVGLIITEGSWVPHRGAANDPRVPRFHGEDALEGWKRVVDEVHAAGGRIIPQLWHVGCYFKPGELGVRLSSAPAWDDAIGPSGVAGVMGRLLDDRMLPASQKEIDEAIEAYACGAQHAHRLGFDGVALHGGHGYLIDQFLWARTNLRTDAFGGDPRRRAKFAAEIVAECRRRTSPDFPILFRISQWKLQDYDARLVETPGEFAAILEPLAEAGVDVFDCSQRRFWEPVFAGSTLNLAGWAKALTGKTAMSVGSVGLQQDLMTSLAGQSSQTAPLDDLIGMLEREEFDLIAVGRALLADPLWASKVKSGDMAALRPFEPGALKTLS